MSWVLILHPEKHPWLDSWVKSMVAGQANMDAGDWTDLNPWVMEPYVADDWIARWQRVADGVNDLDAVSLKALADSVTPSLWRKELRFLSFGAKTWEVPVRVRLELAAFFKKMLDVVYDKDPFGLRSNLPRSYPIVQQVLAQRFEPVDGFLSRQVGNVSASCPPLAWGLFTDFYYSHAYDLMGLFDVSVRFGPKSVLMVKQFGPFECKGLWPDSVRVPKNQVLVGAVYKDLQGHLDLINHFVSTDSLAAKLTHACVLADGNVVSHASELRELADAFARASKKQFESAAALSALRAKEQFLRCKYYAFKPVFDFLHLNWEPSKKIRKRLDVPSFSNARLPNLSTRVEKENFWKNKLDPRIDFSPSEITAWRAWRKPLA